MGDVENIEKLAQELKESKVAVPEPVTPPVEEVKEIPTEEVKIAEAKPEVPMSERVQARIDGLIERQIEKDKRIAELERKLENITPAPANKEPTDQEVQALLNDPNQSQYHGWAAQELARRTAERTEQNIMQKLQLQSAVKNSYENAKAEFPEMADQGSVLWQKANEIYMAKGLDRDPDGQYIAAVLASRLVAKEAPIPVSNEVTEKKLAKETAKRGLATISAKAVTTNDDRIAKLEKEAYGTRPGSPEMMNYLAAIEADRLAKKRK